MSEGEKPKIREAMEQTIKDLRRVGVSPERARELAREAAIRADRNVRRRR